MSASDPAADPSASAAQASSSSSPSSSTYRPARPDLCYPRPNQSNVTSEMFTVLLEGPCTSSAPNPSNLFLARHILTHALAHHYENRSQEIGQFLYLMSLKFHDRRGRLAFRKTMARSHPWLAQMRWFVLFSECCARNSGREAFEALRWAEKEMNGLRGSLEMDEGLVGKVGWISTKDDEWQERQRRLDPIEADLKRKLSSEPPSIILK